MELGVEQIKSYLGNVLELEKNKFALTRAIYDINEQKRKQTLLAMPKKPSVSMGCGGVIYAPVGALIGFLIHVFLATPLRLMGLRHAIPFAIIGALIPVIFAWIATIITFADYKRSCEETGNKNRDNAALVTRQNQITEDSSNTLQTAYRNTETALNKAYAVNIVYPKYRNFVAMSSIYEYFDSGRCTTLAEAYNTYELELRLDRIIDKLDVIIVKLEEIKQNQFYIYNAIQSLQPRINQLTSAVERCATKLDRIEANTAVTAYTTEIIERNQFFMKNVTNTYF